MTTTTTATSIEYRVTALGLNPRYFDGPNARYAAHKYASARPHLRPTTWWRHIHERGSGPWRDILATDPKAAT